jgi:DNA-binding response OmpR family regulator
MSNLPKILIIDDEPFVCDYLEEILTFHGYEIDWTSACRI